MHNIMMNRSKMLIRRASTREGLLKKQREQELQSIEALTEDYRSEISNREILTNRNRLRKAASSSYVLQEIPDNSSFALQAHSNVGFSRDDNDNDNQVQHGDTVNGLSENKLVVSSTPSLFHLDNASTATAMYSPAIDVTLGISFSDGNDNNNIPQVTDIFPSKTYRRSRSCGVILSLRYNLNDNDKVAATMKNDNINDNDASVTSLSSNLIEDVKNNMNETTAPKFARSRSLMLLASRGRSVLNNGAQRGSLDSKAAIQEDDERCASKAEGHAEGDTNIGRFTKVFHETDPESAMPREVEKADEAGMPALSNVNKNKRVGMPVIKPQLMPHNPKLEKPVKEKERNGLARKALSAATQTQEFDSIDVMREDSDHSQKDSPRNDSSSCDQKTPSEGGKPTSVPSNEQTQMPKMRRQGSVDPPALYGARPLSAADMEGTSSGCFKTKKSKKRIPTDKVPSSPDHSGHARRSPKSSKKTRGFDLSLRPSFLSGFYKNVLPPIYQVHPPTKGRLVSSVQTTHPMPSAQTKQSSSDTSSPSFPDIPTSRHSTTTTWPGEAPPSDDVARCVVSGQKRVHVSSDSDGSATDEAIDALSCLSVRQSTGREPSTSISSTCPALDNCHTAPSSGYQSQSSMSDMSSPQLVHSECVTSNTSITAKPLNGASASNLSESKNPAATTESITDPSATTLGPASTTVPEPSGSPDTKDNTMSGDTRSEVSCEIAAVSKPRPVRKCRKGSHPPQQYRLTGRCSTLDIDVELSPELFSFLTSPCAGRRGAICAVIDDMQGRPLTTVSSLVVMEDMMV